jgi:diguanylate cyclase (GGDEF)-like protein
LETIGAVVQCKDITERKRSEEALKDANRRLAQLATVDGLTQLANRRTFDTTLQQEWRRMRRNRQPLSIILCDIDYFKRFNDHYGHQAGDDCLKAVAKCIKGCVQRPADLAARYGGEEFVVVLPNTPPQGALYVAENVRSAIVAMQLPHRASAAADCVTLSLGVATQTPPPTGGDAAELVKSADGALYESKAAGRNAVTSKDLGP